MQIHLDESCEDCGGSLVLETEADQDGDYDWVAHDGDEATCTECGLTHSVHHDGESGEAWLGA
jgi:hypothetical protein